jgi:ABC-type maltose transport system permease subunit
MKRSSLVPVLALIMVVFLMFQKYIVQGLVTSSLKG